MPQFLTGTELSAKIESIINNAKVNVILISPYIKLSPNIKRTLSDLKSNPNISLLIVFGKNDGDYFKSISRDDFEYLKSFPNLEIKYEPDLHAKVYMSEKEIILSSMNLYDYSQSNNIEFGVYGAASLTNLLTTHLIGESFDEQAVSYFGKVVENAKTLYLIEPEFEKGGVFSSGKYMNSTIVVDELSGANAEIHRGPKGNGSTNRSKGFCIRTGVEIPFNPKQPFSKKAFESWNRFKDENYAEKYCHFSGEPSNGETSFAKPILKKNWAKAMKA